MTKLLHIKIFILVILITLVKVDLYAQTVLSPAEDVCAGELKQYKVEGSAGSTIYWSVEGGTVYNGGSPVIDQDLVTPGFQYSELIVSGESLIGILWNVTAGDYLVRAFEETAGSCVSANMDLTVTVSNLPDQSLTLNNSAVCPGGTASITLTNSESGVNYQLRLDSDDSDVGTAIAGTGGNITFDVNPLVTTVYNVYAENLVSTCGVELDNKSTVTVEDVIDPVAVCQNVTIQLDASGNTSITPAQIDNGSTDNCTAVASLEFSLDKTNFTCADLGANTVVLTVTDASSNVGTCNAIVTVEDTTKPVADAASLADVTAQCEVTSLTAPTATDNCDGAISGTHSETFPITASKTVVWTYTDGSGNSTTQTQNVLINDTTDPLADAASLSDVTAQCEVTSLTAPTATDNCDGAISGTHSETFPITASKTVVWTYTDGSGNTSTQTQNVLINDTTDPLADAASLSDVTAQCEVTSLTAPTATDNCDGAISGTHSETFPITASKNVVWTYTDGSGNTSTQTQNVLINDTTDPLADAASLSDVTAQCEVTSLTAPTATDNCDGAISGTHSETFPITASKTVVWTYTDGSGNTSTQTQNVVINDTTDPVIPILSDVIGECTATAIVPTTTDNCAGVLTGTTSDPLTYNTQGTHVIAWTFDDGNGNSIVVNQNVIINDVTSPILADLSDLNIIDCAEDESVIPQVKSFTGLDIQATRYSDNCATSFIVQYRIQLPDSSFANAYGTKALGANSLSDPSGFEFPEGISMIHFRVLDASGNISNAQTYTVTVNHKPIPSGIIY
ncbi:hypothetical protein [Labilibaculum manganireducens]|uniref:HYR-like domain-containing protein n=1 Tax=Labilibaculum manganireducens TaxID=1940525 RepID=UPI0029F5C438|nr:hypothetical protein [Labilibaculum manganireducens]